MLFRRKHIRARPNKPTTRAPGTAANRVRGMKRFVIYVDGWNRAYLPVHEIEHVEVGVGTEADDDNNDE